MVTWPWSPCDVKGLLKLDSVALNQAPCPYPTAGAPASHVFTAAPPSSELIFKMLLVPISGPYGDSDLESSTAVL